MNLEDLLGVGYFPKELPPPFNTKSFTKYFKSKSHFKGMKGKKDKSNCSEFSIPKIGYLRTKVSLVNPYNYLILCEEIKNSWPDIEVVYNGSTITTSLPKINTNNFKTEYSFSAFKEKALIESLGRNYLLTTDISRFYSSIYTHSIPWALHTKEIAKSDRTNALVGNRIDTAVRNCQDQQTNGIPIGPITSLIIAELLLCSIDKKLEKVTELYGKRYIDDYMLFFKDNIESEIVLKEIQIELMNYQLEINNGKTKIESMPYILEDDWITEITNFVVSSYSLEQRNFLTKLYSKVLHLVKKHPNKYIVKYLIQILKSYYVEESNWNLF